MMDKPSSDVLLDFEQALLWKAGQKLREKHGDFTKAGLAISLQYGNCFREKEGSDVWPILGLVNLDCLKPDPWKTEVLFDFGTSKTLEIRGSQASVFEMTTFRAKRVLKLDEIVLRMDRIFGLASLSEAASLGSVSREAVLWKLWQLAANGSLTLLEDARNVAVMTFGQPEKLVLDWSLRGGK